MFNHAAPAANAYPGDPMPSCETNFLGAVICDGPIRPDGIFQRCSQSPGSYTGGQYPSYFPSTTNCQIVNAVNGPWPLPGFGPDHHIE
jgi:hypothetical protein